jgi:ubiquinone/menaquinone biosynthesis C-methylase UbiE
VNLWLQLSIFGLIWLVTFIPAWYLLFKLALQLNIRPRPWKRLLVTGLTYELVNVAPYVYLLFSSGGHSTLVREVVWGVVLAAIVTSLLQVKGLDMLQRHLWRFYARFYDGLLDFYPYRELITLVSQRSLRFIRPGATVADLGAGTGNVARLVLADAPKDVRLSVVEPAGAMLRRARRKLTGHRVSFHQQTALAYLQSLPAGTLDVAILSNVLYALPERAAFWQALLRALKPTGVAVITNSDRGGSNTLVNYHRQHDRWYKLLKPRLIMVGLIDSLISDFAAQNSYAFLSADVIAHELQTHHARMAHVQRCYGGEADGVNLLFEVAKA